MKILYLTWTILEPRDKTAEGVHKKIYAQVDALRGKDNENENTVYIGSLKSKDTFIIREGKSEKIICEISRKKIFRWIRDFVKHNDIKYVYIRNYDYTEQLGVLISLMLTGVKIFLEIPTYPFYNETSSDRGYLYNNIRKIKYLLFSRLQGLFLKRIVTYSSDKRIWGVKTINISNGIDSKNIPLRKITTSSTIRITAVAMMAFWHGLDRLIKGANQYVQKGLNNIQPIKITIAGGPTDSEEFKNLSNLIKTYNLENIIKMAGPIYGQQLDDLFDNTDICIGSLGRHRSKIKEMKALKNVEYALRGFPFCYSENNPDFDNAPYVCKIPANESPLDIEKVIQFHNNLQLSPQEIRSKMPDLSWTTQMKKVLREMNS